jgi:hypothetical protein
VHRHGQLARQSDRGALPSDAFGQADTLGLERGPSLASHHQRACRFIETGPQHRTVSRADASHPCALARLVLLWRLREISPHLSRRSETSWIVDCRFESECRDNADARSSPGRTASRMPARSHHANEPAKSGCCLKVDWHPAIAWLPGLQSRHRSGRREQELTSGSRVD